MTNIDPTLRALGGSLLARYQLLQLIVINIGAFGAAYQLLDNIFIGREVEDHQCSAPDDTSSAPEDVRDVDWNSSAVSYRECEVLVNRTGWLQSYDCPFGQAYQYPRHLSFRTEFDLVCDYSLLGSLAQSFVIIGQGVGAVIASILSDRFGRKHVLVLSQLGLGVVGVGIGLAPNYAVLGTLKFIVGGFQQGVVTGMATMSIELFPTDSRHFAPLLGGILWSCGACTMSLVAYLMREYTWRYLQYALSAVSLLAFVQLWYVDESLRWLVANGRRQEAIAVLKRASHINGTDFSAALQTLGAHEHEDATVVSAGAASSPSKAGNSDTSAASKDGHSYLNPAFTVTDKSELKTLASGSEEERPAEPAGSVTGVPDELEKGLEEKETEKLSVLDIFRHRRILFNSCIIWFAWFTCAFSFFALYMMSTTLHGNRFLNYFLTALMEVPPGFFFYFLVNRLGRRPTIQLLYLIAGVGLISSGVLRIYSGAVLGTLSVVASMVGMFGASGMFGAVFFYTPEVFPTNMRNQALGVSSFAGRLGGMIAPFMSNFAQDVVWGPGVLIGTLCFAVVVLFRFLPETKGRELPHTMDDIQAWYKPTEKKADEKAAL